MILNKKIILVFGFLMFIVMLLSVVRWIFLPNTYQSLQLLPAPKSMPAINLEIENGNRFSVSDFAHYWNLIFFGFTSCPDMCPTELQELSKLLDMTKMTKAPVRVIFISVDPERDSHEKIQQYLSAFNAKAVSSAYLIGLRGDNRDLANMSHFFTVDYERHGAINGDQITVSAGFNMPDGVANDYQVIHAGRIFVVNPDAQYIGSFSSPVHFQLIQDDLKRLIKDKDHSVILKFF